MQKVLKLHGYNLPNQQEQERQLSKPVFENNYTELIEFCKEYDAFQDMPFSQGLTYVAADALFPNSKFILTEREAARRPLSPKTRGWRATMAPPQMKQQPLRAMQRRARASCGASVELCNAAYLARCNGVLHSQEQSLRSALLAGTADPGGRNYCSGRRVLRGCW